MKQIGIIMVATLITFALTNSSLAQTCLDQGFSDNAEVFIYSGDRGDALKFRSLDQLADYDGEFDVYWTRAVSVLVKYLSADFSEWRTPDSIWAENAIIIELDENQMKCVAVLDDLELFAATNADDSYLVRTLQHFEYERIMRRIEPVRVSPVASPDEMARPNP